MLWNKTFFRFLCGFVGILAVSIFIIFFIGSRVASQDIPDREAQAAPR